MIMFKTVNTISTENRSWAVKSFFESLTFNVQRIRIISRVTGCPITWIKKFNGVIWMTVRHNITYNHWWDGIIFQKYFFPFFGNSWKSAHFFFRLLWTSKNTWLIFLTTAFFSLMVTSNSSILPVHRCLGIFLWQRRLPLALGDLCSILAIQTPFLHNEM